MPHPVAIRPEGDEDLTRLEWQVYYLRLQCDDIRGIVDRIWARLEPKDIVATGLVVTEQPAPIAPGPTDLG